MGEFRNAVKKLQRSCNRNGRTEVSELQHFAPVLWLFTDKNIFVQISKFRNKTNISTDATKAIKKHMKRMTNTVLLSFITFLCSKSEQCHKKGSPWAHGFHIKDREAEVEVEGLMLGCFPVSHFSLTSLRILQKIAGSDYPGLGGNKEGRLSTH